MRIYQSDFQKCTRCAKRHLECYFKFSERGCRNDLSPRRYIYPTLAQDSTSSQPPNCAKGDCYFDSLSTEIELNKDIMSWCGIVSDPGVLFFATSNRLHYTPLIHANVSSGASCRACVEESYRDLDVQRLPVYVSPAFLRGFMFSQNQLRLLPSELSRPQLRTLLYQYLTRLDIIVDFGQRRSSRSSNNYSEKLLSPWTCQ
jgi:hypothetical protein